VESLQPIAIALKRGPEMVDDLMHHFVEVDYFIDRCLKCKHKM